MRIHGSDQGGIEAEQQLMPCPRMKRNAWHTERRSRRCQCGNEAAQAGVQHPQRRRQALQRCCIINTLIHCTLLPLLQLPPHLMSNLLQPMWQLTKKIMHHGRTTRLSPHKLTAVLLQLRIQS